MPDAHSPVASAQDLREAALIVKELPRMTCAPVDAYLRDRCPALASVLSATADLMERIEQDGLLHSVVREWLNYKTEPRGVRPHGFAPIQPDEVDQLVEALATVFPQFRPSPSLTPQ